MSTYDIARLDCAASIIPPANIEGAWALDLGCGLGKMALIVRKKGYAYVGYDLSKNEIAKGSRVGKSDCINFVSGDVCCIPFNRKFKLVLALEVIEHLEEPKELLREINRVLVVNGHLLISTPNRLSAEGFKGKVHELISGRTWNAWNDDHKYIFSSFEFLHLLNVDYKVDQTWGYYFLPRLTSDNLEDKWWFGSHLRYSKSRLAFLNKFGFQIIVLLKKIR